MERDQMRVGIVRDRVRIERFLRRDAAAHVYALADLDDVFWPDTRWFAAFRGSGDDAEIDALCLRLDGLALPIVYAVCPADDPPTRALLERIDTELPDRFFYNLGPGLAHTLRAGWLIESHGTFWKMRLADPSACEGIGAEGVCELGLSDLDELRAFLDVAYRPDETGGLFFDARMLASGCYRGVREGDRLAALAGVHVHSVARSVAGIGNVVTHPDARGRGLATRASAAVIRALRAGHAGNAAIGTIGLNVHESNTAAQRCYGRLGFVRVCRYEEGIALRLRRSRASRQT